MQAGPSDFKSPYHVAPTPAAINSLMIFDFPVKPTPNLSGQLCDTQLHAWSPFGEINAVFYE